METTTTITTTTATTPKPRRTPRQMNGVDTPVLLATIGVVKGEPGLARFVFRATNRWQKGTHSRTHIQAFDGAGGTHTHQKEFAYDADHPPVLVGGDEGPTPVEFLLHALASCLTAGIANVAAARGVTLHEVESTLEGDIDLRGILGISDDVRNGYQQIRVRFRIRGDAPDEKLRAIVEQSRARSAVYDVLTRGVGISMTVESAS